MHHTAAAVRNHRQIRWKGCRSSRTWRTTWASSGSTTETSSKTGTWWPCNETRRRREPTRLSGCAKRRRGDVRWRQPAKRRSRLCAEWRRYEGYKRSRLQLWGGWGQRACFSCGMERSVVVLPRLLVCVEQQRHKKTCARMAVLE